MMVSQTQQTTLVFHLESSFYHFLNHASAALSEKSGLTLKPRLIHSRGIYKFVTTPNDPKQNEILRKESQLYGYKVEVAN